MFREQSILDEIDDSTILYDMLKTGNDKHWTLMYYKKMSTGYFTFETNNNSSFVIIGKYDKTGDYMHSQSVYMTMDSHAILEEIIKELSDDDFDTELAGNLNITLIENFRKLYLKHVLSNNIATM
jgi:predicted Mrr-cat superfamily restriction endonuclease